MCIAVYKPTEAEFPFKRTLRECFNNNPDGAGYMVAHGGKVHIRKGFATFSAFWKDLRTIRDKVGDRAPYVLHFRISTQAGVRADCTHPFPLSRDMADLRALRATADIGIAHNGIITLTSHGWNKTITHSDTMEFITDYAARLIKTREWYKDPDLVAVIEQMAASRLAILDGAGHCELLGNGWTQDGGVWYSNQSYKPKPAPKPTPSAYDYDWCDLDSYYERKIVDTKSKDPYSEYYDAETGLYFFDDLTCPATETGNTSFCDLCAFREDCFGC